MNVQFLSVDPRAPLGDVLDEVLADAVSVRVAVAYCTKHGVDQIERICAQLAARPGASRDDVKVVVSVRAPTNLKALAKLAKKHPDVVAIHLGRRLPEEEKDKGHFHSKVVAVKRTGGRATVIVGSHNWTGLALYGRNLEASVRVDSGVDEPFAKQAREHVRACRDDAGCEVFDPKRLAFYLELQHLYAWTVPSPDVKIEDFSRLPTLVLHAEASESELLQQEELRLYMNSVVDGIGSAFVLRRKFRLHLYPPGTMFTAETGSAATPVLYKGTVTMANEGDDGRVSSRPINAMLERPNFNEPRVKSAASIPQERLSGTQVVVSLKRVGEERVPLYHFGGGPPKIGVEAKFVRVLRQPRRNDEGKWLTVSSREKGAIVEEIPSGQERVIKVSTPGTLNDDQRAEILAVLRAHGREEKLRFGDERDPPAWFTRWFYAVSHMLERK